MFTSNDTPAEEFRKARELGAIINLDDISHIPFLAEQAGLPELLCLRYNPGPLREGNAIIGKPEEAKYGFTREQLFEGYRILRDKGVKRFGLHTMVASNELNPQYFVDTARMLFDLVVELKRDAGDPASSSSTSAAASASPTAPSRQAVDLPAVSRGIEAAYEEMIRARGLHPLRLYMEMGRMITGPYGYLVTRVLHLKDTYRKYVGLDACMANLMRPGMYGAYHHITVLGKEDRPADHALRRDRLPVREQRQVRHRAAAAGGGARRPAGHPRHRRARPRHGLQLQRQAALGGAAAAARRQRAADPPGRDRGGLLRHPGFQRAVESAELGVSRTVSIIARLPRRSRTSRRTSCGVPKGKVRCSSSDPQKHNWRPYFFFRSVGSMLPG